MGDQMKKQVEKFEDDYEKIFSKSAWEPKDITMMKDLQKLMYYLEVRCAMKEGEEYPGSEYMDERSNSYNSYARGGQARNAANGRYMSRGGSGTYPMYYDDMRGSGRRYYDGEKEDAIHKLYKAMDSESNPEYRMAVQEAIRILESK